MTEVLPPPVEGSTPAPGPSYQLLPEGAASPCLTTPTFPLPPGSGGLALRAVRADIAQQGRPRLTSLQLPQLTLAP